MVRSDKDDMLIRQAKAVLDFEPPELCLLSPTTVLSLQGVL
jgi:hypothetical protein